MDDHEVKELIGAIRGVLRPAMERSPEVKRLVGLIGKWLMEEAGGVEAESDKGKVEDPPRRLETESVLEEGGKQVEAAAVPAEAQQWHPRAVVSLKLGDTGVFAVPVAGTTEEIGRARSSVDEASAAGGAGVDASLEETWWNKAKEVDLALIEVRSRLKARSCEIYLKRNELMRAGLGEEQEKALYDEIGDLLRTAKATKDCFLWVLWRERVQPPDDVVGRIGQCYRALSDTAAVMRRIDEAKDKLGDGPAAQAMQLMAEADSALRVALEATWLTVPDRDQDEAHLWLRRETAWRRVYIARHMQISDPGDPDRAADVIAEARVLADDVAQRMASAKELDAALKRLRFHAGKAAADQDEYQFEKIAEAVQALAGLGVSPRDRRVAEAIGPGVAGVFPARLAEPPAVKDAVSAALRLGEGERFAEVEVIPKSRVWSARALEARRLVEGRAAVLIGGEPRNDAIERLQSALGFSHVEWVHLTEHGSSEGMRGPITRPETALVLVLIKLTGHLHAEEASRYAKAAGKPCVFLPAGYNPEQVAEAMLTQAGLRLRERVGI